MTSLIKKRKHYKPLLWIPENVYLDFVIHKNFVFVTSIILFKKNNIKDINNFQLNSTIDLNGVNLETCSFEVSLDNQSFYDIDVNKFFINDELISIPISDDVSEVRVVSKIKLYPTDNTSLEGLYESNKMLCTQCEPEGFRKITWFPDRPDCLTTFKVRIEAPLSCSTILSNGNLIEKGILNDNNGNPIRHFKVWDDPFPKPSYLFALVVGSLEVTSSSFVTSSNKKINLEIYTEIGNKNLTQHAMNCLKKAMEWDQLKYGLEYDLECFMIVAVSHFNMGAMENKGLNIFNSKFILADLNTATDLDLKNIESIVAHEYFHNWTGNRVTCRDWFQLTLKEGLTVFRDQEFSADMNNRGVKRIEDVMLLRSIQFPEDSGSNKHPIRPDEYQEINNFYTPTVYEKGAEVIRMIYNYLGAELYRKGIDVYFEMFDGKAVTCEDFLEALSRGSNIDLDLFKKWYSQAGTPELNIQRDYNNDGLTLSFSQSINKIESCLPIPITISLIDIHGYPVQFSINNLNMKYEHVFLLSKNKDNIILTGFKNKIVPSLLRGFSAPVNIKTDLNFEENIHILKFDNDSFNKWESIQNLYISSFKDIEKIDLIISVLKNFLIKELLNPSLMACLLELPSRTTLEGLSHISDPIDIFESRVKLSKQIALRLKDPFEQTALKLFNDNIDRSEKYEERSLLSKILNYLVLIKSETGIELAQNITLSKNMTLSSIGLKSLCQDNSENSIKHLNNFYSKWSNNSLVLEKWFEMMSILNIKGEGINFIKKLLSHDAFDYKSPNKLRSVLGVFQRENTLLFHANDCSGYNFVSEQICLIDSFNSQAAARLVLPLTRFNNYTDDRKKKMKNSLYKIYKKKKLSSDLSEIIAKALK